MPKLITYEMLSNVPHNVNLRFKVVEELDQTVDNAKALNAKITQLDDNVYMIHIRDNVSIVCNEDMSLANENMKSFRYLQSIDFENLNLNLVESMEKWFLNSSIKYVAMNNQSFDSLKSLDSTFSQSQLERFECENSTFPKCTSVNGMFSYCVNLQKVTLRNTVMEKVKDASLMFFECWELEDLDLTEFKTLHIQDARKLFAECKKIVDMDLSFLRRTDEDINESKYKLDLTGVFSSCTALNSVKFGNISVTDLSSAFFYCTNIKKIDMSELRYANLTKFSDRSFTRVSIDTEILLPDTLKVEKRIIVSNK